MTTVRGADLCALSLSKRELVPFDRLRAHNGGHAKLRIAQPKRAAFG
jgi:hypothetical protein